MGDATIILDRVTVAEGPRWHDGRIWFTRRDPYESTGLGGSGSRTSRWAWPVAVRRGMRRYP
jgi:hypothetical protein